MNLITLLFSLLHHAFEISTNVENVLREIHSSDSTGTKVQTIADNASKLAALAVTILGDTKK